MRDGALSVTGAPVAGRAVTRPATILVGLALLLAAVVVVGAGIGTLRLTAGDVLRVLTGDAPPAHETVLLHLRFPRIALALLVGGGLAMSGVLLQGVVRNPLADPGLLGINAGAGLAAAVYVASLSVRSDKPALPPGIAAAIGLPLTALAGGALAAALVYSLSRRNGVTPARLLVVGIAVGQGLAALTMVVLTRLTSSDIGYAKIWLTGSLWSADWTYVVLTLPAVALLGLLAWSRSRVLDVLALGDVAAVGLGVPLERERRLLLGAAAGLASACVAVAGGIGFVGLFAPHIARRLVGGRHAALLPAAALVGAIVVCAADLVGHAVLAPREIPAGVLVAAIGAPTFLWLLARTRS